MADPESSREPIHIEGAKEVPRIFQKPKILAFEGEHGSPYCDKCTEEHDGLPHFYHETIEHASWYAQMMAQASDD